MKYKEVKPNVSQHVLKFDREEDENMFWRCNWARITLDHENYSMTATTDCGDYSYTWCATPDSESFLELMCRIDRWYLLDKIANRSDFNLEESKRKTIENLQYVDESYLPPYTNIEQMKNEINEIEIEDDRYFLTEVERITDDQLDSESIEIAMEYPKSAETFCEVFCDYLQPKLRDSLKNSSNLVYKQ